MNPKEITRFVYLQNAKKHDNCLKKICDFRAFALKSQEYEE